LGIGAGLLWQMGDNFSARIDCGIPLIEVNVGDRTLQEQGLYFSIEYAR
jgi:hemolysin activation/secretion protein